MFYSFSRKFLRIKLVKNKGKVSRLIKRAHFEEVKYHLSTGEAFITLSEALMLAILFYPQNRDIWG